MKTTTTTRKTLGGKKETNLLHNFIVSNESDYSFKEKKTPEENFNQLALYLLVKTCIVHFLKRWSKFTQRSIEKELNVSVCVCVSRCACLRICMDEEIKGGKVNILFTR